MYALVFNEECELSTHSREKGQDDLNAAEELIAAMNLGKIKQKAKKNRLERFISLYKEVKKKAEQTCMQASQCQELSQMHESSQQ